jgi:hypothetical protein
MKRLSFSVLPILTAAVCAAQSNTTKLSVVDESGALFDYFNVIVQNPGNSTCLRGETALNRKLEITHSFEG